MDLGAMSYASAREIAAAVRDGRISAGEAVEAALEGQPVTADAVRSAAEAVAGQVDPLADFRGSSEYKRDMAVVFTRRALEQALGLGQ